MNNILLGLAYLIKVINPPHAVKYCIFLLLKNRLILVEVKLDISHVYTQLNLGDFIDYWIFMDGLYEKSWILQIRKMIKNKIFIDIGANIGVYSLSLCKLAKKIYAFEPEKINYQRLSVTIKNNDIKNILPIRKAVFSKNKQRSRLFISPSDKGWHSLLVHYTGGTETIETITLDRFAEKNKITPLGLIKIDVEGAEIDVIKGAKKLLTKFHPPLLVEFNRYRSQSAGYNLTDLYHEIVQYNYLSFRLRRSKLIKLNKNDVSKIYIENLLFIYNG